MRRSEQIRNLPVARRVAVAVLLVCVVALIASTVNGIAFALLHRERLVALFPGATGFLYWAQVAAAVLGIVTLGAVGLFRWWGPWAFLAVSVAAVVLDVLTQAPRLHLIAATVSSLVVLALAWVNRALFARGDGAGS
jgi:hypothetical protein